MKIYTALFQLVLLSTFLLLSPEIASAKCCTYGCCPDSAPTDCCPVRVNCGYMCIEETGSYQSCDHIQSRCQAKCGF